MASFGVKLMIVLAITPILEIKSLLELEDEIEINSGNCDVEKGEIYMACRTECPLTCDNYTENQKCPKQCVAGCFCPRGTVRRESDQYCVKPADFVQSISQLDNECDTPCIGGPNDICKICAWACPDTCDNVDNPPPCHAPCKPNTCDCVEGTVRNLATGQCVLPMSCPSKSITHFNK
ncbi:hypothetical protein PV328_011538 [Microctonus aethiopoides]|uniref:TIL domain-containing protein n=1 Tax=Microctonus aethiopoides TaxID=144406 RepID=A0AA39C4U1_9HYME|nr:hypothetical protein PV328_011538 [Microctonus aethiopoides]